MASASGPVAGYRRYWLPELLALAGISGVAVVVFGATDLDIAAARLFYRPDLADPWPVASRPVWHLFYRSAPWVTGSLAAAGVSLLVAGAVRPAWRRLRLHGLFILLCVAVGPGLIVNGILKDHWGRPRPRQVVEFGGRLAYAPPLLPAPTHGKSFPCGHCSVGYLYGIGWWVWRRRRPGRAAASLAAGLLLGTLLGIGRMAAGGHFLSDAVWSGLIAFGVAHVLYYYALRVPAREDRLPDVYPAVERSPRLRAAAIAGAVLLALGIAGGGLLATPHHRDLAARLPLAGLPGRPEVLEILAGTVDVEIRLVADAPGVIVFDGYIHGFGLPASEMRAGWEFDARPVPTLRYRVRESGWFTDVDGVVRVHVPARGWRRIVVRTVRGDIGVEDATGGEFERTRLPALDLLSEKGRVRRPSGVSPAGDPADAK